MLSEKEEKARKMVCLPLDGLETIEDVKARVEELSPFVGLFKIGKESFTRFGPEVVKLVKNNGSEVFLDLKYHDIPNTVKGASAAATKLGVYMFNVHASGGVEMMKAAIIGAREACEKEGIKMPKIIGVTVLTSIDKECMNNEIGINGEVDAQVLKLAKCAANVGLDGIVCAAADLGRIKSELPKNFLFVTPGIKGPNTAAGADQKRVFTPGNAIEDGSTTLVIGRAITGGKTPKERQQNAMDVLKDIAERI